MGKDTENYLKESYKLAMRSALILQRLVLLATCFLALAVIGAFAAAAYAVFVAGVYFTALLWFAVAVILFFAVRGLARSSQDLLREIRGLMEAAAALQPSFQDESVERLHRELHGLFPLARRRG